MLSTGLVNRYFAEWVCGMDRKLTLGLSVVLDPSHSLTLPLPAHAGSEPKLLLAQGPCYTCSPGEALV